MLQPVLSTTAPARAIQYRSTCEVDADGIPMHLSPTQDRHCFDANGHPIRKLLLSSTRHARLWSTCNPDGGWARG